MRVFRIAPELLAEHLDLFGERRGLLGQLRHECHEFLNACVLGCRLIGQRRNPIILCSELGFQLGDLSLRVQQAR